MIRRDVAWRAGGLALFAAGCAVGLLDELVTPVGPALPGAVTGPLSFAVAVLGLVLLVQGKRVPVFWRVERGRHRDLPAAIHLRRRRSMAARTAAGRRR